MLDEWAGEKHLAAKIAKNGRKDREETLRAQVATARRFQLEAYLGVRTSTPAACELPESRR